jgi:L-aspartate oxidase
MQHDQNACECLLLQSPMERKTDFLVVGSGIAGLTYALKVSAFGKVLIITKANADESNTKYAQGGIAAVTSVTDSFEKHISDTLACGDGLCNENIVRMVVTEGKERIDEIIEWGARFDKKASGEYDLAREGGHTHHRVLHHKDNTGYEIERALLQQVLDNPNIEIITHYFAVDIITQHHFGEDVRKNTPGIECYGVYALNFQTKKVETILAKAVVMATGGSGQVYNNTTNPLIATGDGIAMVYRAKGRTANMEFMQFHPTALYKPSESPSFLISEAVRGSGGILRNRQGEEFMHKYDVRKSLAPRDIVARAIDNEMKISGEEHVCLDCTAIPEKEIIGHFPNIHNKCLKEGIDIAREPIPVVPAAHYMCGGIEVDEHARSSIKNLYAIGECASTGLHGANRLASNSLLEALVFAHRAFLHSTEAVAKTSYKEHVPAWDAEGTTQPGEMVLITHNRKELQSVMSDYVGIMRSDTRLQRALDRTGMIFRETEALYEKTVISKELCELRNLINVSYQIIRAAMARKENTGLHYNTDNPKRMDEGVKNG